MKTLREYFEQEAATFNCPRVGDGFSINAREEYLLETYVCDETEDGIVLHADDKMISLLEGYGWLESEEMDECNYSIDSEESESNVVDADNHGEYDQEGAMAKDDLYTIVRAARRLNGMLDDEENMPEWVQSKINKAADYVDTAADYIESNKEQEMSEGMLDDSDQEASPVASAITRRILMQRTDLLSKYGPKKVIDAIEEVADFVGDTEEIGSSDVSGWIRQVEQMLVSMSKEMDEAKYQGREVPLGKPMQGDVKKSKVYVKGPKGNVVKVNFGDPNMKIKKSNPARRKSFRARHHCENPGPRWKARYWSCRAW
jgi:hypothetical protein